MRYFPYDPTKPLPVFLYNSQDFLEKYHFNINRINENSITRPHYHDYFQLYYILSGSCRDTINGTDIVCNAGDVVLAMPYTTHAINTVGAKDFKALSFSFRSDIFRTKGIPLYPLTFNFTAYENKIIPTFFHISPEDKLVADRLIMEMHSEYQRKSNMLITKVFKNLNAFLSLCAKASDTVVSPDIILTRSNRATEIGKIVKKLKWDSSGKCLIEKAARDVLMSRRTFTNNFRAVTGITYHDMLTQIRLMKAVDFLRYTRKSIAEIATETGFSSNAHFTKECIKIFSLPPQPLRRELATQTKLHRDEIVRFNIENEWSNMRPAELRLEAFNNSIGEKK